MTERRQTYSILQPPFRGSFPNIHMTEPFGHRDQAFEAAPQWCRDYRARDTLGNMATVLGVHPCPDGTFIGIANYYHSNS